ncbi:hypothetical protein Tco_0249741, partial [Tanacetum coccineum]
YEHVAIDLVSQLESGTSTSIFKYHALKQLAIKQGDEYGFVIRPGLVGVTFKSVRIDLSSDRFNLRRIFLTGFPAVVLNLSNT